MIEQPATPKVKLRRRYQPFAWPVPNHICIGIVAGLTLLAVAYDPIGLVRSVIVGLGILIILFAVVEWVRGSSTPVTDPNVVKLATLLVELRALKAEEKAMASKNDILLGAIKGVEDVLPNLGRVVDLCLDEIKDLRLGHQNPAQVDEAITRVSALRDALAAIVNKVPADVDGSAATGTEEVPAQDPAPEGGGGTEG